MNNLIHTPEGVRDVFGQEYRAGETLRRRMSGVIGKYGYVDIKTPTLEFYELFAGELGSDDPRELYKLFDRENNTLVLRPDFTPGVARACAKYFLEEKLPVRLTYHGSVFNNLTGHQGKLKEISQVGAELVGDKSVAGDAEVVAMNVRCLYEAGLSDFRLTLGHVDVIKGVCEEAGIDTDLMDTLAPEITAKNRFAIEELLHSAGTGSEYISLITELIFMLGDIRILDKARTLLKNEKSRKAIDRLYELYELLKVYGVDDVICFDMGMFSKFQYYTGVIFKAYAGGAGEPVSKGGRYDLLFDNFGIHAPAVGFVAAIDVLASLLKDKLVEDEKPGHGILIYRQEDISRAVSFATDARCRGEIMELIPYNGSEDPKDYIAHIKRESVADVYMTVDGKIVKKI